MSRSEPGGGETGKAGARCLAGHPTPASILLRTMLADPPPPGEGKKPQAASAALAFSAIAWNDAGSWMARSDSTLRSTVMPDLARPLIKTL
jgi:hypothetical protein